HGIHKSTFNLHLKECEFRFNYRNKNIYIILLENFRNIPLN
ncbi:MAG: IS1595 family transposase, partial [Candidatus Latescibacteria bacterium]|nr:IS1595 family transposase [Candidatus Latescibacterota bacterium]MBT4483004.1 IS1595 family transposase [Candidatus Latescibacterota bacterium]